MSAQTISVREAKVDDLQKLVYNDYSLQVELIAVGPFTGPTLTDYQPCPVYEKRYDLEVATLFQYLDKVDLVLFVAVDANDTPVGHVAASKFWNGYASIDDIAIDLGARRRGCASALMAAALEWTRQSGLPGIRAETQHSNVAACKLYQQLGFKLGGYDAHLYDALAEDAAPKEVALFWYLHV